MDNLTHSLFGAAVADLYLKSKEQKDRPHPRTALYTTSILANNFPDLDLLFALIDNSQLGYLLNHRGWTHTIFGTLLQSLLLVLFLSAFFKFYRPNSFKSKKDLWILSLLGCQTHILLDFFNSYGVHPFWPLSNQWYYLDSIFIIEPLLWIVLVPIWLRPRSFTWLLLAAPVFAYSYGYSKNLTSIPSLIGAAFLFLFCLWLYKKRLPSHKSVAALGLFFLIVLTFLGHQKVARNKIYLDLAKNSRLKTLDVTLSPLPSNPNCWLFLAPQISKTEYRVLAGAVAIYSDHPSVCFSEPVDSTLSTSISPPKDTSNLVFRGAWSASLEELLPLLDRCDVLSWFKFARVPIWQDGLLNDLRFASRSENNFSSYRAINSASDHCPPLPAPWIPPRTDLLDLIKNRDSL